MRSFAVRTFEAVSEIWVGDASWFLCRWFTVLALVDRVAGLVSAAAFFFIGAAFAGASFSSTVNSSAATLRTVRFLGAVALAFPTAGFDGTERALESMIANFLLVIRKEYSASNVSVAAKNPRGKTIV